MTERDTMGWRCPECGEHYVWHGLKDGRPMCPPRDIKEHPTLNTAHGEDQKHD